MIYLYFQKNYETSNPELVNQCLEVIGAYVAWIDIALVANDRFIELLLSLLHRIESREAATDCLHDIISKGMEPLDKLQLIETLVPVLQSSGILKPLEVKFYGLDAWVQWNSDIGFTLFRVFLCSFLRESLRCTVLVFWCQIMF